MDKPLNSFGQSEPTEWFSELDLDSELDLEQLRDNHPELALKIEEHTQETMYE